MNAVAQSTASPPQGMVYTFYSYKGGVGRSMALANVAALLARWGKKVLVIDWDLEAPGIERFFGKWLLGQRRKTDGLLELIHSATEKEPKDWRSCVLWAALPKSERIAILHAGRDDAGYAESLRDIDWDELFDKHRFAYFLESLRESWTREFDFVLIDSRTGITDIGGVCSIFMPDVLITLFTATEQSLDGVRDVMMRAREKHAALALDRRHLLVVPIPARDESGSEYKLAAEWRARFAGALNEFFVDWMPRDETAERILNHLKIPYFPYWSFGERLPAIEEDPDNPKTLAFSYQLVARLLLGKLDWEEVRKGTQASEAGAAQSLAAEEKTAEAARIRAQAQKAEAERELLRTVQDKADLEKHLREFFVDRIQPLRRTLFTSGLTGVFGIIGSLSAVLFALWRGNFLWPPRVGSGNLNWDSAVYFGAAAILLGAGVFGVVSRRRKLRLLDELERETALLRARVSEYSEESLSESQIESRERGLGRRSLTPRRLPLRVPTKVARPEAPYDGGPPPDIFISYRQSQISDNWLKEFLPLFRAWVTEFTGREPRVFVNDSAEHEPGAYVAASEPLLRESKCFIPIVSKAYFASDITAREWSAAKNLGLEIMPITLTTQDVPPEAQVLQITDFTAFAFVGEGFSKTERYVEFQTLVREMAQRVADVLGEAVPAA